MSSWISIRCGKNKPLSVICFTLYGILIIPYGTSEQWKIHVDLFPLYWVLIMPTLAIMISNIPSPYIFTGRTRIQYIQESCSTTRDWLQDNLSQGYWAEILTKADSMPPQRRYNMNRYRRVRYSRGNKPGKWQITAIKRDKSVISQIFNGCTLIPFLIRHPT